MVNLEGKGCQTIELHMGGRLGKTKQRGRDKGGEAEGEQGKSHNAKRF